MPTIPAVENQASILLRNRGRSGCLNYTRVAKLDQAPALECSNISAKYGLSIIYINFK
jgi:hypothetical protein